MKPDQDQQQNNSVLYLDPLERLRLKCEQLVRKTLESVKVLDHDLAETQSATSLPARRRAKP